jgi:hypothetical protein
MIVGSGLYELLDRILRAGLDERGACCLQRNLGSSLMQVR